MVFAGYRLPKPVETAGTTIGTNPAAPYTVGATDPALYRNILTVTLDVSVCRSRTLSLGRTVVRVKIGIHLPQYGRVSGPDAITTAARDAEELGFSDVWVSDHIVHPAAQNYPSPHLYDPLLTLAWAAAATERVGLGTSVLVVPMHEPVALANQLASLDALSKGRLTLAVGVGWSAAEYEAVGADFGTRGRRLDEALELFRVLWRDDPASFEGTFRSVTDIRLLPKPVGRYPLLDRRRLRSCLPSGRHEG